MKIGNAHLTYCTNIHAGETWAEVRRDLERYTLAVKRRVCPDAPFGVGLRLSARAAQECDVDELKKFLDANGMYVFTINGFPHGAFHATAVKEWVYRPDWREAERVAYTNRLADILAALLPEGVNGSISTVPICFAPHQRARKPRINEYEAFTAARANLARSTSYLRELYQRTGRHITLALEPEPSCLIETFEQTVSFFNHADNIANGHLGLCLDACHAAVEFDTLQELLTWQDPALLRTFASSGAPKSPLNVAKVQLSCGLRVSPVDDAAREALTPYAEGVYLHQTVARDGTKLTRYDDLPDALAERRAAEEWRIHFHVPIFHADIPPFGTTQPFLEELLAAHKRQAISTHLEVETYTWDVLPPHLRDRPIDEAIAAELSWVLARL